GRNNFHDTNLIAEHSQSLAHCPSGLVCFSSLYWSRVSGMRTYSDAFELALMSARCARCASTKRTARELWKIAQEYQAEAAKLGDGTPPDIGEPPQGLEPL